MNDCYGETIWQYVEYWKYFNRHSTRLGRQTWQTWDNVILLKFPRKYLKRSRRWIQQIESYSRSAKREVRTASNDAVRASPLRRWVSYWFWILSVRTTISRPNKLKSTFRKPEQSRVILVSSSPNFEQGTVKTPLNNQIVQNYMYFISNSIFPK